ncbi:MAG: hypothetical protein ACO3EE_00890 [Flavobacteriales bacterium]
MKNVICIFLFSTFLFSISSCDRVRVSQSRMEIAGPKKIARYKWTRMDSNGDFTEVIHDTTDFGVLIFWDNEEESLNNVTLDTKGLTPAGWFYANVGAGVPAQPVGWYVDYELGKTLTLWSAESLGGKSRVTYTMSKNYNASKINLVTTYYTDKGTFKEELELESLTGND